MYNELLNRISKNEKLIKAALGRSGVGGSSFLPVTGTGTATGNIIGDLDGNTLQVQQGGTDFLTIDPTVDNETSVLRAFNVTGGSNFSNIYLIASPSVTAASFLSNFDGGAKVSQITAFADATTSALTYTADTHTLNGVTIFNNQVRLKNYTVATLPTGTMGDIAFVTDALAPTYMVAVVGGGAIVTPVFYNGTAWVAH